MGGVSAQEVEDWLIGKIAAVAGMNVEDVDPSLPFADYNLDSSVAVTLSFELGNLIDQEVPVTSFWEFPNIELLSMALGADA